LKRGSIFKALSNCDTGAQINYRIIITIFTYGINKTLVSEGGR